MTEPTRISPEEAAERMAAGAVYIDVRTEPEFAEGHPAGAFNVPFLLMGGEAMTENSDFLPAVLARFPKDTPIVVGCKSGGRSLRAARALLGAGYSSVVDQRAGWAGAQDAFGQVIVRGWSRAGLPTEAGEPPGRSYRGLKLRAVP
jgi:rhodanese-related sulfurtransferase